MSRAHHRRRKAEHRSHHDGRRSKPPAMVEVAREALKEDHPAAILDLGSSLVSMIDPRRRTFDYQSENQPPSPAEFIESSLIASDPASLALGWVVGVLGGDLASVERVEGRLRTRGRSLPAWLSNLEPIEVTEAIRVTEDLGDTETILLRVRTGHGDEFALDALIDHNMGGVLKDGFLLPGPWADLKKFYRRASLDPEMRVDPIAPVDACARITDANETYDRIYPPIATETWPGAQPVMEWVLQHVGEEGRGLEYPAWSDEAREAIKVEFLASPFAAGMEADDVAWLDTLLWFACDYGPCDPYHWSPQSVEILLLNWIPRKIAEEVDYLDLAPRVLDSFIRFAHAHQSLSPSATQRTIQALDVFTWEYREIIRNDRPQGALGLLAQAGLYEYRPQTRQWDSDQVVLQLAYNGQLELARQVGGFHHLHLLDVEPLLHPASPAEGLDEPLGSLVAEIDALCQRCAGELFDREIAAACRLLLADLVRADARVLTRGKVTRTAATIVWLARRVNDASTVAARVPVKELLAWFGVKGSVSSRAVPLVEALGVDPHEVSWRGYLGTPRYLTSHTRRYIKERAALESERIRTLQGSETRS